MGIQMKMPYHAKGVFGEHVGLKGIGVKLRMISVSG
jgi:hypothetical protein